MTRNIQIVKTSEDNSLFIIDFKDGILTFRTSRNPQNLQKEKVVIEGDKVFTNLYFSHISYLEKLLNESKK